MIQDTVTTQQPLVRLTDIQWGFHEATRYRQVLNGVNFQARAGELIAITGPSGSGKSTLLNLIGGIDRPQSGEVMVAGRSLSQMDENQRTLFRRHHVGFIFQFFNLVPTLTVAENLRLPLSLIKHPTSDQTVSSWLDRFDLRNRANAFPDVLSGGEQQRIATIRAAIHSPGLILADEPTGNLDASTGESVLQLLETVARDGACIVMVTHSQSAAKRAHRQYDLRDGQLLPMP